MQNIIIAFGSIPKDGGTFTFFRTIRPKLLEYGIDIRCVSIGKSEASLWDTMFANGGCVLIAEDKIDIKDQVIAFTDWCEKVGVDVIMPINSVAMLSALPHLPEKIRVLSRCAAAFDHGYKITVSCYSRLTAIVATTPKQIQDLTIKYGAEPGRIRLIPNGIDPVAFDAAAKKKRGDGQVLRLGFLGRLEHQKGVLLLPEIVRILKRKGIVFKLSIAGKGVHGKVLERKLKPFIAEKNVELVGPILPQSVPDFLGNIDVFLFPSRIEGCPNALLEGIMAGCVPVVSQIEGITDFIIRDGRTGFVCPMDDCEAFAERIADLASDRGRLQQMAARAAAEARERFSQERAAKEYAQLIEEIMQAPPPTWTPLPWSAFQPDPAFANSFLRSIIPKPFKRSIKKILFYLRLSDRYET